MTNPLSRLVVDESVIDLELLAGTLEPIVRLDLRQGGFAFLQGVRQRLNTRQQVLVALLSQKALHLLDERLPEALRPQEIEASTGIRGGTLRPVLKRLSDGQTISQDASKGYFVPAFAIEDAAQQVRIG
jgi:hypothetical protein